jgi:hypothetical protein
MLTHARAAVVPRSAPPAAGAPSLQLQPPEPWAALLDQLGSIEDETSIIVLGRDGPDLMCALLRAGAPNVTHLCSHQRLEADSASLVIIPHSPSPDWLRMILPALRRALSANGRIVLCTDPLPSMQSDIRRSLTLHGFTSIRVARASSRLVISAELPAFGLRRCA